MSINPDALPVLAAGAISAAAGLALAGYAAFTPASSIWGPVISRGNPASRQVALTFDDGPLPGTTDPILDTLGEAGVRAAFFVIGQHVRRHPALVRRIHEEGHLVCNHSDEHLHAGLLRRYRYWSAELRRADDAIADVIGKRPAIMRPPMGFKHWHIMNAAADAGHAVVTWSRRARDVRPTSPAVIIERLSRGARGGDVMVLHDGNDPRLRPHDRAGTRDAVRPLIDMLRSRGLEPARLDDLLGIPAYCDPIPTAQANRD